MDYQLVFRLRYYVQQQQNRRQQERHIDRQKLFTCAVRSANNGPEWCGCGGRGHNSFLCCFYLLFRRMMENVYIYIDFSSDLLMLTHAKYKHATHKTTQWTVNRTNTHTHTHYGTKKVKWLFSHVYSMFLMMLFFVRSFVRVVVVVLLLLWSLGRTRAQTPLQFSGEVERRLTEDEWIKQYERPLLQIIIYILVYLCSVFRRSAAKNIPL